MIRCDLSRFQPAFLNIIGWSGNKRLALTPSSFFSLFALTLVSDNLLFRITTIPQEIPAIIPPKAVVLLTLSSTEKKTNINLDSTSPHAPYFFFAPSRLSSHDAQTESPRYGAKAGPRQL